MNLYNKLMYWLTLNHELGHANCINRIVNKKYTNRIIIKPTKIIIGYIKDCKGKKCTKRIGNYYVYCYSKKINGGMTLTPHFKDFTDEEIKRVAKAGLNRELITGSILSFISIIGCVSCFMSPVKNNFNPYLRIIILVIFIIFIFLPGAVSIFSGVYNYNYSDSSGISTDKMYINDPSSFKKDIQDNISKYSRYLL